MNLKRKMSIFLTTTTFMACHTIKTPIPGNHFISPEVSGELLKGRVGSSFASETHVVLARDIMETPSETNNPDLRTGNSLNLFASLGVWEKIDVRLDSALGLGGVIQIFGKSAKDAIPGNWSIAIHSHAGSSSRSEEFSSSGHSYDVKGTAESTRIDIGTVAGYRVNENFLPYVGIASTRTRASGETKKIDKSNGETNTYMIKERTGDSKTLNIGFYFGSASGWFGTLETGYMVTTWPDTKSFGTVVHGANCGYSW
jgi:hypothetical protein